MLRLVFDTSTPTVVLGLWTEEGWMEVVERKDLPRQQSKIFFQCIEELFRPFGIEKKEITEIAVGSGPGSYTGLRMGITVAKVWSFAQKVNLYSFSSGDLLARTQSKRPEAEVPDLHLLKDEDLKKVENLSDFGPEYSNDHFAEK